MRLDRLAQESAERALDALFAGPLPEALGRSLAENDVLERVAAELLHEVARWPSPRDCPALEAGKPASGALAVLRELKEQSVALSGHEPYFSTLASLLCAGSEHGLRFQLKKGGVAAVEVDGEIAPGSGRLLWAVTPKILGAWTRAREARSPGA